MLRSLQRINYTLAVLCLVLSGLSCTSNNDDSHSRQATEEPPEAFDEAVFTTYIPDPEGGGYLFNDEALLGAPGVWYVKEGVATKVIDAKITTILPAPEGGFYAFNAGGPWQGGQQDDPYASLIGKPGVWYLRNGRAVRVREQGRQDKGKESLNALSTLEALLEEASKRQPSDK
jgi:hypothetical protein